VRDKLEEIDSNLINLFIKIYITIAILNNKKEISLNYLFYQGIQR